MNDEAEMVDRVAAALWAAIGYSNMDGEVWSWERALAEHATVPPGRRPISRYVSSVRHFARVAVEEMRSPTEARLEASSARSGAALAAPAEQAA